MNTDTEYMVILDSAWPADMQGMEVSDLQRVDDIYYDFKGLVGPTKIATRLSDDEIKIVPRPTS